MKLYISQKDTRPLYRFQLAVCNLGKIYHNKEIAQWVGGKQEHIIPVIGFLWNYLSEPKREQIERVHSIVREWRLYRGYTPHRLMPIHGTTSMYTAYNCRCRPCKDAAYDSVKKRRAKKKEKRDLEKWLDPFRDL